LYHECIAGFKGYDEKERLEKAEIAKKKAGAANAA